MYANKTVIEKGTVDIKVIGEEYNYGFIVQGTLNVKNGSKINVETKISNAIQVNGSLTVSDSTVNAESDARIGMRSSAIVNIKDGSSIVASGGSHGIFAINSMTIAGDNTSVRTEGGTGYGLYCDTGSLSIEDNAVVTALEGGVAADTYISVNKAELHSNTNDGSAMKIFKGSSSDPVSFVDSNVVLVSNDFYGLCSDGTNGNHVYIEGCAVSVKSKNDGIFTNMSFDIVKSKVNVVSSNGIGICSGLGVDTIMDSDVTVSRKTYGIVTDKTLTIKNSVVTASVTGDGASDTAIESQNGEIKIEKTDLFIKTPDNGRVKDSGSGQIIKDKDGKPAKTVKIVKAVGLKEIRFEFPVLYDGDTIDGDFKITSVPANVLKSDTIVETIKELVKTGGIDTYYQESEDGKTFKNPGSDKYVIDKYYQSQIPFAETVAISLAIVFDKEKNDKPIFDRNKVQFVASDLKVYVNGKEYKTDSMWVDVGKAVGSIKKAKIADIAAQEYTGKALTPEPKVTYGSKTLKKGTDYTLSFKSNTGSPTKKTTATVTVTGKGSYALSASKTFTIEHTKHVKDKGKTVKEPTVKETGTKEYHCTVCGKLLATEEIAKLPPETEPETEPDTPDTPQADAPLSPEKAISLKKAEKALKKV